jgi:hypothetical protein
MLRDNLVGLIEPMCNSAGETLSRCALPGNCHRTIDPHALKIPAPKGRNLTLTDNALLHFRLSQDMALIEGYVHNNFASLESSVHVDRLRFLRLG